MKASLTCIKTRVSAVLATLLMLSASSAVATVTLEVYFENGSIPSGALAAIVADTASDGFLPLTDPAVSGSILSVGQSIGGGDDTVIATFNASAAAAWFSGAGLGDTIPSLDYAALGISEGTPLVIYVFPELTAAGTVFIIGDEFVVYRNSSPGGSGGDIPFEAPMDPGVYTLAALTPDNGGDFNPGNLAVEETYLTGNTGTTGGGEPDDVGNSRNTASSVSEGQNTGNLTPGDLDFYEFTLTEAAVITAETSGDVLADGWIFDEFGNAVYSPGDGSGTFAFSQLLQPGKYYLGLKGSDETQEGDYTMSFAKSAPRAPAASGLPDLTLGKSLGKQSGLNVYSPSGAGQTFNLKSKAGKRIRAYVTVGNVGGSLASISLMGSKGNTFYKIKYLHLAGGGNVSGSVGRGGFISNYAANQRVAYRVDLKPTRRGKERAKNAKFKFDAAGVGRLDRGKLKARVKKK